MENNSNMESLTAEDIEVKLHRVPISTYDGDRDVGAFHLEIIEDWSESQANELKQQILSNQDIVQRLKVRINELKIIVKTKHHAVDPEPDILIELKSILEKQA